MHREGISKMTVRSSESHRNPGLLRGELIYQGKHGMGIRPGSCLIHLVTEFTEASPFGLPSRLLLESLANTVSGPMKPGLKNMTHSGGRGVKTNLAQNAMVKPFGDYLLLNFGVVNRGSVCLVFGNSS